MATRPIISPPGSIHKITQRITTREFLLRPDSIVTQLFLFLLGYLQSRYKLEYHLASVLSNHLHILLTDVLGDQVQAFNTHFFSLFSKALNFFRNRTGNVFDPAGPNCVAVCPRAEDVIDHGCYISKNVVEAKLVSHAKKWPGVSILPHEMGRLRLEVERPKGFFDPFGVIPERVTVEFTIPKVVDCEPEELRKRMSEEHNRREQEIRDRVARAGRRFKGRKAILRQSIHATPKTPRTRSELVPEVACKDASLRTRMLEWRKRRNQEYRELLERVREGIRDVCFPVGTWYQHFRNGFERRSWTGCPWRLLMEST